MNIKNKITVFLLATVIVCSVTAITIMTFAANYNEEEKILIPIIPMVVNA